jgi:hypothetical protein
MLCLSEYFPSKSLDAQLFSGFSYVQSLGQLCGFAFKLGCIFFVRLRGACLLLMDHLWSRFTQFLRCPIFAEGISY